jgi:hypothetical protein
MQDDQDKQNRFIQDKFDREAAREQEITNRRKEVEQKVSKLADSENLLTVDRQKSDMINRRFQNFQKETDARHKKQTISLQSKKRRQMSELKAALE